MREELAVTFARNGYSVTASACFDAPEAEILAAMPDLVILDLNLPGKSGFVLCKLLKATATFPILVLTSRDTMADELHALELGADDFLTKPCHPDRLLARADRLLRTYESLSQCIKVGDLLFDPDTFKLIHWDEFIILPETEWKIMHVFLQHPDTVLTKKDLFSALWGGDAFVDENILAVNMTRLRKSLDSIGLRDRIQTIRGQGYRLEVNAR